MRRARKVSDKLVFKAFDEIRPTQVAVGMRAVAVKRAKMRPAVKCEKRLRDFLKERALPVVLGPNDGFYLVDRHHMSLALLQHGVEGAYVQVIDDLSYMEPPAFWQAMEAEGRAYLFDERGQRVRLGRMPDHLSGLRADPYRDIAWALREAGAFKKVAVPFSEFRWAAFFRARIPEDLVNENYEHALLLATRLAMTKAASTLPGYLK